MVRYGCRDYECTVEMGFDLVGGKWKPRIVWWLGQEGTLRFRELERRMPDTTRKVLVQQLRALEADGILRRTVHAEVPPRVEYALTGMGQKLVPIIRALETWAEEMVALQQSPAAPKQVP